jgi:ribonuclease-3
LENLSPDLPSLNPKGQLQEVLQAISPVSPVYPILSAEGPEHQKHFVAMVKWLELELGVGSGRSKKDAEIAAARDALEKKMWESAGLAPDAPRKKPANKRQKAANK